VVGLVVVGLVVVGLVVVGPVPVSWGLWGTGVVTDLSFREVDRYADQTVHFRCEDAIVRSIDWH